MMNAHLLRAAIGEDYVHTAGRLSTNLVCVSACYFRAARPCKTRSGCQQLLADSIIGFNEASVVSCSLLYLLIEYALQHASISA